MVRFLLHYLLPLLAPTVVYILWLWYARRRARKSGDTEPAFTKGGLFWSIIAGSILLVGSLIVFAVSGGVAPDSGVYQAPRLEDGKIVGPEYLPPEE